MTALLSAQFYESILRFALQLMPKNANQHQIIWFGVTGVNFMPASSQRPLVK
jgi:hypothetical protein